MNHSAKYIVAVVVLAVAAAVLLQMGGNQTISGQATGICYDSDGGMNLETRGRIDNEKTGSVRDNCLDNKILLEGYCAGGVVKTEQVNCVSKGYRKCEIGICVK